MWTPMIRACAVTLFLATTTAPAVAQDHFESLPGHDRFQTTARDMGRLVTGGRVSNIVWLPDGSGAQYRVEGKYHIVNFATGAITEIPEDQAIEPQREQGDDRGRRPPRGRQLTDAPSPDGAWIAECRDWNLHLRSADGATTLAITTDGHADFKYATACWVYGEELNQNTAMWWSPDSTKLAFYEFDERQVRDYYLTTKLTDIQNELYVEAYPKPGAPNPMVGLLIYDVATKKLTRLDLGSDPEQYVYNVRWSPSGAELLFNRTNRHQSVLDVMAADPKTGQSRIVLTETQPTWQDNAPTMRFLADGRRFIWETERTGWKHYELRSLDSASVTPLTRGEYPCHSIQSIDEVAGWMYYTAYSAPTPIHQQLHRVRLDGTDERTLTGDDLGVTASFVSPDHGHFIATMESVQSPPRTCLYEATGRRLAVLTEGDTSGMEGRPMPELFTFKADDGMTDLYGVLFKPSDFDPSKRYPLLVDVYGGPQSQAVSGRFVPADPYCELGFITARIDNRGTVNRGKAFESATYLQLGTVDLKDQADGVRFLAQRPYIDGSRVGIHGHSYGGYMAALAVLKHPDVFRVAVAGAPVTDWRNYDTIYTERYMRTPQENAGGYDAGSCMTFADQLVGDLLILHGMVDDNVHPANSMQLVHKLQEARKRFQIMVYPESGHGIRSPSHNPLKWEFLVEHLVAQPVS